MAATQELLLGEGAGGAAKVYIEDVFSTYLYTGSASNQTIINGIDLAGKGGLVWQKNRSGVGAHILEDTVRGVAGGYLNTASTAQQSGGPAIIQSFNSNGFTSNFGVTASAVSWTFRKQPKFFDVVTYTGNGAFSQEISHSLASTPGFIVIKRLNSTSNWATAARISTGTYAELYLNTTGANLGNFSPSASSTSVFVGGNWTSDATYPLNASGATYVMYLFAHDAGGFGLTGTDNVISCGSFTTDGSGNATVSLGYEPQWVLVKQSSAAGQNWIIQDNMRGFVATGNNGARLYPNTSGAESATGGPLLLTSTGFNANAYVTSSTCIYIAIRRGPMKVPTDGTKVFAPVTYTGDGSTPGPFETTNFPVDLTFAHNRGATGARSASIDRLRGGLQYLDTNSTAAESSVANGVNFASNTGVNIAVPNSPSQPFISWNFGRAPSFFDEVCYTGDGTGTSRQIAHNLGVVPELYIFKARNTAGYSWNVAAPPLFGINGGLLNSTAAFTNYTFVSSATSSYFTTFQVNDSGVTYVGYLFATCPGVSKVGSYTGNGSTQAIACGFTGGARFVLIKRTDSTGGWYVYDTARGMTTLTDPYLFLNSTAAESATLGSVTTTTGGFTVDASILAAINTNAASYIFLAIA